MQDKNSDKKNDKIKNHPNLTKRVPPHSIEAEQCVLGCILISENAAMQILPQLAEDDFYSPNHRVIYSAMKELAVKDSPCDIVTVVAQLNNNGQLEKSGGLSYVTSLSTVMPSAANANHYTQIVQKNSVLRRLINSAGEIADLAFSGDPDDNALQASEQKIYSISEKFDKSKLVHASQPLDEAVNKIEFMYNNPGAGKGIPTGFKHLDKILNGFQQGDLILIAARPSEGKTSLGMNFIAKAIKDGNRRTEANKPDPYKCAVFSLEMPSFQLMKRMLCSIAKIDMSKVNSGNLSGAEWTKLHKAKKELDKAQLYIDDSSLTNPIDILSKCRRLQREKGLDLVMIDYLQLMSSGKKVESRQNEVAEITRHLKIAAKELKVPIILLSQMSREIEKRKGADKMPQMSDLRESGAIEQDADVIIFIHRKYSMNDETVDEETKSMVDLIIAKHRNGERGKVRVRWRGDIVTFEDMDLSEIANRNVPPQSSGGSFVMDNDYNGDDPNVYPAKTAEELLNVPLKSDGEEIF